MTRPAQAAPIGTAPRNAKELADWMTQDARLRQAATDVVVNADQAIDDGITQAFLQFIRDRDIDLNFISHDAVTEALNRFYRSTRLAGRYIRMW
jgi:hypothetical protein